MSSRFERLAEKLSARHPEFDTVFEEAITYDIAGRDVELLWCGLRDEKTHRR
jgi:hypothetical protein